MSSHIGLLLLLSVTAGVGYAQSTSPNEEWQGTYTCGPILSGPSATPKPFTAKVSLQIEGNRATLVREGKQFKETIGGIIASNGTLVLSGNGQFKTSAAVPWRTRFEGKFQDGRFSATGLIDSQDGSKKYRECTLSLDRSSPAKVTTQDQPAAVTTSPSVAQASKQGPETIPATGVKTPEVIAVPPLNARVTDLTNTLSSSQRQSLEAALAAFEKRNGSQIAVLMLPSTQPETIEQYSMRVADRWKSGRTKLDDGVILVIAKDDQRLRIEVGYGLEGAIPNVKAKRIISEVIAPRLKEGEFFVGIRDGSDELMSLIEGASLVTGSERVGRQSTIVKASPTVPAATQAQSTVTKPSQVATQPTDVPGPVATPPGTSTQPVEPVNQAALPKSESTAGSVPKAGSIESSQSAPGERANSTSFDSKALLLAALAGAGIVGLITFVVARLRRRSADAPSDKHLEANNSAILPVDDVQKGLAEKEEKAAERTQSLFPNDAGAIQAAVHVTEDSSSPGDVELRDEQTIALAVEPPAERAAQMGIKYRLIFRGFKESISESEAKANLGKLFSLPIESVQAMFTNSEHVVESGLTLDEAARLQKVVDASGVECVVEPDQQDAELPDLPPQHEKSKSNMTPQHLPQSASTGGHASEKMEPSPAPSLNAQSASVTTIDKRIPTWAILLISLIIFAFLAQKAYQFIGKNTGEGGSSLVGAWQCTYGNLLTNAEGKILRFDTRMAKNIGLDNVKVTFKNDGSFTTLHDDNSGSSGTWQNDTFSNIRGESYRTIWTNNDQFYAAKGNGTSLSDGIAFMMSFLCQRSGR